MGARDPEAEMARLIEWGKRTGEIAAGLMEADPSLPYMTATIVANDILSAELRTQQVRDGADATDLVWLVGSYARWDWTVAMVAAGRISEKWFFQNIGDLWRGSDPDDTKRENLDIWKKAAVGRGLIRDGAPLPKPNKKGTIRVYRGGSPFTVTSGFAWTTDIEIAAKFAATHGTRQAMPNGVVVTGDVKPGDVLAYLTGRGESEVIVDPANVKRIHPAGLS